MTAAAESPAPRPGRRERRKREVHDRIVEAAVALFERKGFAATTALEIAERADVAEKTFYNHFPTKQHLVQELAALTLADVERLLEATRREPGTTRERLARFFARAADDALGSSRELARELVLEMVRVAQVEGVGPERSRRLHAAFAALLAEGVARGDVPSGRDLDFLAEVAVASYLGIIINWVSLPDYPLQDRFAAVASLVAGAAAGPGPASGPDVRREPPTGGPPRP